MEYCSLFLQCFYKDSAGSEKNQNLSKFMSRSVLESLPSILFIVDGRPFASDKQYGTGSVKQLNFFSSLNSNLSSFSIPSCFSRYAVSSLPFQISYPTILV